MLAKRHHYLPQKAHLDFFCKDGLLCVYDARTKQYRRQKPLNTAIETHYYSVEEDDGEKTADIESLLAKVENPIPRLLKRVEERQVLSAENKVALSRFAAWFVVRVPAFEASVNELSEKKTKLRLLAFCADEKRMESKLARFIQEQGRGAEVTASKVLEWIQRDKYRVVTHRNTSLSMMLSLAPTMAKWFERMPWLLVCAPKKHSFVTTDNPFVLTAPPNRCKEKGFPFGVLTPGVGKILPLTQTTCLLMGNCGEEMNSEDMNYIEVSHDLVKEINLSLTWNARRFVIARDEDLLRCLVKRVETNHRAIPPRERQDEWQIIPLPLEFRENRDCAPTERTTKP